MEPKVQVADEKDMVGMDGEEKRMTSTWRQRKTDANRFGFACNGDYLLISFECDVCVFQKVYNRPPQTGNGKDQLGIACIRRINRDAFWSRAKTTVDSNTSRFREVVRMSEELGFEPPYFDPGPLPKFDHCGYKVAILMVMKSVQTDGKYSSTCKQWLTIRKFRSTFSNQIRASAVSNSTTLMLANTKGSAYQHITTDPSGSLWFQRFMVGC